MNSNTKNEYAVKNEISCLAREQLFGILCTQSDNHPYGSMVGLAFSDDLKYAVFATPRSTRKYQNLIRCHNVALVVNNREKHPTDLMKIEAFTATGIAEEITNSKADPYWSWLLLNRQSCFQEFLESVSTALFRIRINRYLYVSSIQELIEWRP